jgi:mannitol/fructose-specific phosphotransferase system IIA component (Ntr-type)/Kef-type K+ transport system membrane component KefB
MFLEHIHNWLAHREPLILSASPLLVLAVILFAGFIATRIGKKLKIPVITSQIIAGIVLGHYVLNIFGESSFTSFTQITNFALGFIGFSIGSHLDYVKLHNAGKRIVLITVFDVVFTPILVFIVLFYFLKLKFEVSMILSIIAITTAPGSIIHIVKEYRAKGIFTKTLLASVALNNVLTILLFYLSYYFLINENLLNFTTVLKTFQKPLLLLIESTLIGSSVGFGLIYFTEKHKTSISFLSLLVLAIIITVGTSESMHFSGILSSLILGIIIANFSNNKNLIFTSFKDIEKEIFILFFVLAGTHLDFKVIAQAKYAGLAFIFVRLIGKTIFPLLGAIISKSSKTITKNIGFAFYPFAGLAIGLVMLVGNIAFLSEYKSEITAIILTAVIFYELIGPIFTGKAIERAGERDKNRLRLMDFLQEEYITLDLKAKDKWEALEKLAEFMYKTYKMKEIGLDDLKRSVIEREKELSTGIGDNIAIPHAILEGGPKIIGVIGISKQGIDFQALDGKPVHIIILIATPKKHFDLHLQVLANIAKIFGQNPEIKRKIINAKSPAEVYELLQNADNEALNPFFEE